MTFQEPGESLKGLEESLKKQILPAAKLTCLLPPAEKTFLENLSCENAVAFIYILFRLLYKHIGNPEPSRKDSIELWERIWDFAQQIPIVKAEPVKKKKPQTKSIKQKSKSKQVKNQRN